VIFTGRSEGQKGEQKSLGVRAAACEAAGSLRAAGAANPEISPSVLLIFL
jgi:hypothetical protein